MQRNHTSYRQHLWSHKQKGDRGPYQAHITLGCVGSILGFEVIQADTVEPREGEPRQPKKAYEGLLGLIRAYWEDVAPLP